MKKFKLKYVAFSLIIAMTASCVNEEALADADKANAEVNNEFTFDEDIHNYEINGKLVYDRNEIATAADNAWNVSYDYPNKKVYISTTPQEFEKLKSSMPEIDTESNKNLVYQDDLPNVKSREEMADSKNDDGKLLNKAADPNAPGNNPALYNAQHHVTGDNDSDDIVLHQTYRATGDLRTYNNTDLGTFPKGNTRVYTTVHIFSRALYRGYDSFTSAIDKGIDGTNRSSVVNHNGSLVRKLTVFELDDFQGRSRAITLAPNGRVIISRQFYFGQKIARSMKVQNVN